MAEKRVWDGRLIIISKDAVLISGDGDFAILAKYLMGIGKEIHFLARGERTAREIRQLAGEKFTDFTRLRRALEFVET